MEITRVKKDASAIEEKIPTSKKRPKTEDPPMADAENAKIKETVTPTLEVKAAQKDVESSSLLTEAEPGPASENESDEPPSKKSKVADEALKKIEAVKAKIAAEAE